MAANLKITQLNAAAALTGDELIECVQDGANVQTTAGAIVAATVVNALDSTSTTAPLSAAQGKALADAKLAKTGDRLTDYHETSATLTPVDGAVTIPLDGKTYAISVTAAITTISTTVPNSPSVGSAVVYLTQDADGGNAVSIPATWYWADGVITAVSTTGNAVTRLTLVSDPAGNVHADAELRKTS